MSQATGRASVSPSKSHLFPERYRGGAFVGQHGSWNRDPPSGYKVIFVPFEDGRPAGLPQDILTGFLSDDGKAYGRPVGVAVDRPARCSSPMMSAISCNA